MRIGMRILAGYLLVVGVLCAALLILLPSVVQSTLRRATGPVLQDQATRLGIRLGASRDPATFLRDIEGLVDAELVVTDTSGKVIYEAESPLPGGGRPRSHLGQVVPPAVLGPALEGKSHSAVRALFGVPVVAGVAPVVQAGRVTGVVIAWRAYGFAAQSVREAIREMLGWMGVALLLAGLISWLLTQGIVRRLRGVGDAARALAGGNLAVRAPESAADELGELGQSFNHMAERIQGLVEGLRKSEDLRRELMASISHELRTPITSIQGFAEALRDGVVGDPEKQRRYHEIIAGEADRLSRLVRDLFDFAKLEAGQFDFRLVALPPRQWLSEFAERARIRLERQGLRLELQGDPGTEPILGDRQRLDQVLDNLVDNAARYSPAGGTVTVTVQRQPGGLQVSVQDQGPGIRPEDLPHIFERFYQGKTRGQKAGGAGLGLAIAQSIVRGHGGQIGVESEPGQGARFWFTVRWAPT